MPVARAPRRQLRRKGIVFTLRRPRGVGLARARHGGFYRFRDLGPVQILLVHERPTVRQLAAYLDLSGFGSVHDWLLRRARGATHLYQVTRLRGLP